MRSHIYPVTSYQFIPSHSIRYYCHSICSLQQLSSDIEIVHRELSDESSSFYMAPYRLARIQQQILNGSYVISPLRVKILDKKVDISKYKHEMQSDYPDIIIAGFLYTEVMFGKPEYYIVVMPDKDDQWVLLGLSLMLVRLYYARMLKESSQSVDPIYSFYDSLQEMGKVDRLYKLELDLYGSLRVLPKNMILEKVKSLVGDGSVYKLISSLFDLRGYDAKGTNIIFNSLPPLGELSKAIFNIVLKGIFDREFPNWFPGISLSRFENEVFIPIRGNDKVIFNDTSAFALMSELRLLGKIKSIGQGDEPLTALNKIVFIDKDSEVIVCTPEQYF